MIAALQFIIEAIANIVLLFILLRFWMPLFRVDFRNPVSQAILKFTAPVVVPLRRVLPAIRRNRQRVLQTITSTSPIFQQIVTLPMSNKIRRVTRRV